MTLRYRDGLSTAYKYVYGYDMSSSKKFSMAQEK